MTAGAAASCTAREAADTFLAVRRTATTTRAYTGTLDRLVHHLGPDRQLATISSGELDAAVTALWGLRAARTWNRQVATVRSWLGWCRRNGWPVADLTLGVDWRPVPNEEATTIPLAELERLWSRRDIPLRERALWRLLYDSAGRAHEALGLDVADVDLHRRGARVRARTGQPHLLRFQPAAARLLGALIAGRTRGPVFLTTRRPAAGTRAAADMDPDSGRARLSYERAEQLFKRHTGGRTLHQLHHSRLAHLGERTVGAPLRMRQP